MDHLGYDFVIMVKGMKAFVHEKIREVQGSFEEKRQYTIRRYQVNGTTVKTKVFYSDEKGPVPAHLLQLQQGGI